MKNRFNNGEEMLEELISDDLSNLDLLDFPLNNLDDVDISNESFLADEIFSDDFLQNDDYKMIQGNLPKIDEFGKSSINENEFATYRDFSQLDDNKVLMEVNATVDKSNPSSIENFPIKLHKIVERCKIDGYSDIISWMPHGRSFKIHDRNLFVSKIMPRYFYITKLTSFIRQLTLYGFNKYRKKGADKGSFYHELFLRGRANLCLGIVRSSEKKRKLESEPNFHRMQYLPRSQSFIKYDSFADVPDRPRQVQYQDTNKKVASESTTTVETHFNLGLNNCQGSSSFEYFHKSQQFIANALFSTSDVENAKKNASSAEMNHEFYSNFSRAA